MKKLIFTLATVLVFGSCRTVEKMVEKGQYDEAIIYATEKLAGKKNKKTKHVKALEEAFSKITKRDMDLIKYLDGTNKPENWDKIYDVADRMEYRQSRIEPFLPLIAKDGYEAYFEFVKTFEIKTKALNASAKYYYDKAEDMRSVAIADNDKGLARKAFGLYDESNKRKPNFKDVFTKKKEMHEFGQVHIKVDIENRSNAIVPQDLERVIKGMNVRKKNSLWRKYYTSNVDDLQFDYKAVVQVTGIDVSPEKETITHYEDSKEVKDGFKFLKDRKGQFVLDTAGQKIKVDKYKTIRASVTEIFREKAAIVSGQIVYFHVESGDQLSTTPLNVEALFADYASSFRGDRKALSSLHLGRLKSFPKPFPNDFEMIIDASENLKGILLQELVRLPI